MPYTLRQVRFLMSAGSPYTQTEKDQLERELHNNPGLIKDRKKKKKSEGRK